MRNIRTMMMILLITLFAGSKATVEAETPPTMASISGKYSTPRQKRGDGGVVTVQRVPQTVSEFKELRELIADRPHGAAACFVIALHIFMEDPELGEECLAMSVVPSQRDANNPKRLASVRQIIYDRFYYEDAGKYIYSPWIPYCYIKGFEVTEGWKKPAPPFTMVFGRNPGVDNMDQSASGTFQGYSIPMTLDAFDNTSNPRSRYRNITAVKLKGEDRYVMLDFDDLISTASYKRP